VAPPAGLALESHAGSPLLAVVGPTGSGKSELALSLAESFPGEIVNCDSLQIYRYFDIGTAKLSYAERRGIPHHLLDVADPDELFTAGDYLRLARPLLTEIAARGRLPIVVGGTGLYLRALLGGLFPGPAREPALRERLASREAGRPGSLHRILRRLDPPSAARIHANDTRKLIRALEVCLLERRPLSSLFAEGRDPLPGFRVLVVGLDPPRQALYHRLDERCRRMFAGGLAEECRAILARGFARSAKPFDAFGYRQALALLCGQCSLEQAVEDAQRATRRYAKRQWTWFRREPGVEWFAGFGEDPNLQAAVGERVRAFHNAGA